MFFKRNEKIQKALDEASKKLLNSKIEDLLKIPDYGNSSIHFNHQKYTYGWWVYTYNENLVHIHLLMEQNVGWGHYKFHGGIKIINKKDILQLTDDELADYD